MNILQLTNKLPFPPKDGGSIATLYMTEGFVHYGYNVTMLAMNTSKHYHDPSRINASIKKNINLESVPVNTDISIPGALNNLIFSSVPYNIQRFINKNYKEKLEKLITEFSFDFIQLEGLSLSPYIPLIKSLSEAKIILRAHNVESKLWKSVYLTHKTGLKKIYLRNLSNRLHKFEKQYINIADALVPITKNDKNEFLNMGCKIPMHVAPAGIDPGKIPDEQNKKIVFPSLFFIGALDWLPNREGILWFINKIWEDLAGKYPGLNFHIAGRNAPDNFRKKLNKKGVIFHGEVENADDFIRDKAIMVAPVFSGSGIRVKILESMSKGKVVISTPLGFEGINAINGKQIYMADTPYEFERKISKLVENRALYNKTGKSARKFIFENFNNLAIIKTLLSFYNSLTA